MDKKDQKRQKILLIVLLLLVLFAVYYFFLRGNNDVGVPTEITFDEFGNTIEPGVGDNVLELLGKLGGVTLDGDALFASPAFRSLTDESIILPNIPTGRENPFRPL